MCTPPPNNGEALVPPLIRLTYQPPASCCDPGKLVSGVVWQEEMSRRAQFTLGPSVPSDGKRK